MGDVAWLWTVLTGTGLGVGVFQAARLLSNGRTNLPAWVVCSAQTALVFWAADVIQAAEIRVISDVLSAALFMLALVDSATLRLPNAVTLPLIICGLAMEALGGETLPMRLIGVMGGYGVLAALAFAFRRLRGREGIGGGDAKLLAAAGAWLGWRPLPWVILIACALAFGWVGVRYAREGRESLVKPLPFGPPLTAAFWIVWLYGAPVA